MSSGPILLEDDWDVVDDPWNLEVFQACVPYIKYQEENERIIAANRKWDYAYPSAPPPERHAVVTFSDQDTFIYEAPEEAADLKVARTSDLERRRADTMRMETMMKKVFDLNHRNYMFNVIQMGGLSIS